MKEHIMYEYEDVEEINTLELLLLFVIAYFALAWQNTKEFYNKIKRMVIIQ
jgi:hypothetical protein